MDPEEVVRRGREWSEAFNKLPANVRVFGQAIEIRVRLQHLYFERDRLKKAYERSLREIRQHEKNLHDSLKRIGSPP